MARNSKAGALRGRRPPRPKPVCIRQSGGPSLRPRAHSGTGSGLFAPSQSSSLDLLAWPQIAIVVHGAARAPSTLCGFLLQRKTEDQGWQESSPLAILVVSPARAGERATYRKEKNP